MRGSIARCREPIRVWSNRERRTRPLCFPFGEAVAEHGCLRTRDASDERVRILSPLQDSPACSFGDALVASESPKRCGGLSGRRFHEGFNRTLSGWKASENGSLSLPPPFAGRGSVQGHLAHKKLPLPQDQCRALGKGLL